MIFHVGHKTDVLLRSTPKAVGGLSPRILPVLEPRDEASLSLSGNHSAGEDIEANEFTTEGERKKLNTF